MLDVNQLHTVSIEVVEAALDSGDVTFVEVPRDYPDERELSTSSRLNNLTGI